MQSHEQQCHLENTWSSVWSLEIMLYTRTSYINQEYILVTAISFMWYLTCRIRHMARCMRLRLELHSTVALLRTPHSICLLVSTNLARQTRVCTNISKSREILPGQNALDNILTYPIISCPPRCIAWWAGFLVPYITITAYKGTISNHLLKSFNGVC